MTTYARPRNTPAAGTAPAASLWRAARLALGTAAALGLARFAYGLLLPAMRGEFHWSLGQAGTLTAANGLGYVAGAAAAAACARRWGAATTFRAGMVLVASALLADARGGYGTLVAARAIAGFAGALVFIAGGVIAARVAADTGTAAPITIYFSGTGLGILLSAATIPPLLDRHPHDWRWAWVLLAGVAVLATAVSWSATATQRGGSDQTAGRPRVRILWRTATAYLLFAAGYIAYITFLSALLVDRHASTGQTMITWGLLGASVLVAPRLWSRPIGTWSRAHALTAALVLLAVSAAIPLISSSPPVVIVSAVAYGLSFMAVPAAVTALIRTRTTPPDWTPTLAAFTMLFAAGQTVGPLIAGVLADHTSTGGALAWTATLCAAAAVFAMSEQRPRSSAGP